MFEKVTTDGLEEQTDRLGGYALLDTDLYDGIVKMAYVTSSNTAGSETKWLNTIVSYGNHDMSERLMITGKAGQNYYEKNGKKIPFQSFDVANSLCLMTTGHPISEQKFEDKVIQIYDYDEGKEVDKNMPVMTGILGLPVTAAIVKQIVNKRKENSVTGEWEEISETREENVTEKYFHTETKRTFLEVKQGGDIDDEDLFYTKWGAKNKGKTRNKSKEIAVSAGKAPASGTGAPKKSTGLFN